MDSLWSMLRAKPKGGKTDRTEAAIEAERMLNRASVDGVREAYERFEDVLSQMRETTQERRRNRNE